MSILLDALIRKKQQQLSPQNDQWLTAKLPQKKSASVPIAKLAILIVVIASAAGLALVFVSLQAYVSTSSRHDTDGIMTDNMSPILPQLTPLAMDRLENVRLAGKVALPSAIDLPLLPTDTNDSINFSPADEETGIPLAVIPADSPITDHASLDALRQQLKLAAKDVGLHQEVPNHDPLVESLKAALKAIELENTMAGTSVTPNDALSHTNTEELLPTYGQLSSEVKGSIPEFTILAHIYSSESNQRLLNVDGQALRENDRIAGQLTIIEIRPRDVILAIDGVQFKVPAI